MSRNRIKANETLFQRLDAFCASKQVTLTNAGAPRWIEAANKHKHYINSAVFVNCFNISQSRKVARFDFIDHSYYITVGLEAFSDQCGGSYVEIEASHLTVLLSEISIRPSVSVYSIKNIVEVGDKLNNPFYNGHDIYQIASIFPGIRVLQFPIYNRDESWRIFFKIGLNECKESDSWIDQDLSDTLMSISELDPNRIPYRVLCRSLFDGDPSNFFLALYRCLEALYAFSSSKDLINELSLNVTWSRIAVALEDRLGWHPKEEGSLERLLQAASFQDLKNLVVKLSTSIEAISDERVCAIAAKRVYALRNNIVHYRPSQYELKLEDFDWISICKSMAGIIFDIYYFISI